MGGTGREWDGNGRDWDGSDSERNLGVRVDTRFYKIFMLCCGKRVNAIHRYINTGVKGGEFTSS